MGLIAKGVLAATTGQTLGTKVSRRHPSRDAIFLDQKAEKPRIRLGYTVRSPSRTACSQAPGQLLLAGFGRKGTVIRPLGVDLDRGSNTSPGTLPKRYYACGPSIPPEEFLGPSGRKSETELKMSSRGLPALGSKKLRSESKKSRNLNNKPCPLAAVPSQIAKNIKILSEENRITKRNVL